MKLYICLFILFSSFSSSIQAQIEASTIGASAWGMGNTAVTLADVWAVGNNPAGMAGLKKQSVGMSYHTTPLLIGNFNTFVLAYTQALPAGVLGMQVARFGDKIYSETKLGIGYAYSMQKVNIAMKVNYVQIAQATLGSQGKLTFEFGAQLPLNKYMRFGVHIYNFTQSAFKDYIGVARAIPTTLKAGLAYQPIDALSMYVEAEKTLDYALSPRLGIAYKIHKKVMLRTGIQGNGTAQAQTQTIAQFAGIGFIFNKFQFDYALASQTNVGIGHHLALTYRVQ